MRYKFALYIFFFLSVLSFKAQAQEITIDNIKSLKIDKLSDEQVLKLYFKVQESGISLETAFQMMEQKGLSAIEIEKLKRRLYQVNISQKNNTRNTIAPGADTDSLISYSRTETASKTDDYQSQATNANSTLEKDKLKPILSISTKSEIYGQAFFNNPKLSFEPDLRIATPQGYVLGADDELLITLSGLNESSRKAKVSPEGNINIPYVGLLFVNGLTIEQVNTLVKSKMQKVYPALASGQTRLNISLGKIRSIRITIVGEVKQPGSYTISSLASLFNALYQSGGPNLNGSMRNVELIRNNKLLKTIDLYDFLQKGIMSSNIRLEDQDVIRIPFYQKRVIISGEIKSPAIYEMKQGESLSTLINFAGNFTDDAYKGIAKVFQKGDEELKLKDVPENFYENYVPQNGDSVYIGKILSRYTNRVNISGAVVRPGFYELKNGITLKTLIANAGGLQEYAFLNRGYIYRLQPDLSKQSVSFDLEKIMNDAAPDLSLQREDQVVILSADELREELTVSISGLVKQPGNYVFREGMQLADLIAIAGGFQYNAANERIEISRIIPNKTGEPLNQLVESFTVNLSENLNFNNEPVLLKALDKITVPQLVNYQDLGNVNMSGEVLFPGLYALQRRDETALELLVRAGGLTKEASLENARIYRSGVRVDVNLTGKEKKQKLILLAQDSIYIPRTVPFVEVKGGVNTAQLFQYKSSRFKYYVNAAGGTKPNVKLNKAYIAYPNGVNSPVKRFLLFTKYPRVTKGSQLFIPEPSKEQKNKLNVTEVSAAATILTAIVGLIAVLNN